MNNNILNINLFNKKKNITTKTTTKNNYYFNENTEFVNKKLPFNFKFSNEISLIKDPINYEKFSELLIYKNKSNNIDIFDHNKKIHKSPSSKEWTNSIYSYDKEYEKLLMYKSKLADSLIESYSNIKKKNNVYLKKYRWYVRKQYFLNYFSLNRIHLGKSEMKHTNYIINITSFFLNKNKFLMLKELNKFKFRFYNLNNILPLSFKKRTNRSESTKLRKKLVSLTKKYFIHNLFILIKSSSKHLNNKNLIKNISLLKNLTILNSKEDEMKLKNEKIFLSRYKLLLLNKYKSKNWFMNYKKKGLVSILNKIYNKAIEFTMIKQKNIQLNSDIFTKSIGIKLKDRKNRVVRILRKALLRIKFPSLFNLSKRVEINSRLKEKKKGILKSLRYKLVNGVRFEASGRLTRRLTASRAVFKVRYVGSLKNVYSSVEGLSSSMMRGYAKSNLQYTLVNSKTANGSFGLKGWVNSF
jgi:hypothetical protein